MIEGRLLAADEQRHCARPYPSVCKQIARIQMPALEGKEPLYLCRACARALREQLSAMEEPAPFTLVTYPQLAPQDMCTLDFSGPDTTQPHFDLLPEDTAIRCQRPFPSVCLLRAEARVTFWGNTLYLCRPCGEHLDQQLEHIPDQGTITLRLYPQESEPGEPGT